MLSIKVESDAVAEMLKSRGLKPHRLSKDRPKTPYYKQRRKKLDSETPMASYLLHCSLLPIYDEYKWLNNFLETIKAAAVSDCASELVITDLEKKNIEQKNLLKIMKHAKSVMKKWTRF